MKNKRILWWLLLSFALCCMVGTTSASAKAQETTEASQKDTKIRLYLGQSFTLTDVPDGEIVMDQSGIVAISDGHKVKATAVGRVAISVKTEKETIVIATIEVVTNEIFNTLVFDESGFGTKIVGTAPAALYIREFDGMQCQWSAETPELASVTEEGVITPLHAGIARFRVKVVDGYGGEYEFVFSVTILEPHFTTTKINLAKGCKTTLMLQDISGHEVMYSIMDGSVASVVSNDSSKVVIKGKKVGKTKIVGTVDGVTFECTITVTNPKISATYGFYQKKKKVQVKLTGINSASTPVWTSSNIKVAKVNARGLVSTLRYGSAVIQCQVDGKTLRYYLAVSTKKAVKAMRYGYKQLGRKKYSQARRMDKNYFDCSSFVYRCYRAAGKYLVYRTSWAPVAADIGKYYVRKGKKIKASGAYKESQLRPGDLICFGGSGAPRNGRYKRIYHIAMYMGNSRTMESSSTYNNVVIRERSTLKKKEIPVVVRP